MAYGMDSGYGMNGGGEQDSQASQAQAIQKQQQAPYAAKTGAALSTQAQKPTSTTYTRGTSTSPVTPDGKINEQNQPAPPPAPAPAQPQPTTPKPGADWVAVNGGWVPSNHPLAAQAQAQQPAPAPGSMPGTAPQGPQQWGGVNTALAGASLPGRPGNTQYSPGTLPQYAGGAWGGAEVDVYGGGGWGGARLPNQTLDQYGGTSMAQYRAADQSAIQDPMKQALLSALQGPGPVNPELLKASAKDDSLAMMKQLKSQSADAMAARGLSGGGADQAAQQRIDQAGVSDLLGKYRGIEIDAATKNRDALMQALGMGETMLSGEVSRAGQQFQNTLAGQVAAAQDKQSVVDSANKGKEFALSQALAQAGIDKQAWDSQLEGHKTRVADQLSNAALSKDQWQSGVTDWENQFKGAVAQEGLDQGATQQNSDNYNNDVKSILAKMGIDLDKYKADVGKEVGMAGVEADKYGSRMNALSNLLGIMESARAHDQSTGVDWGRILTGAF